MSPEGILAQPDKVNLRPVMLAQPKVHPGKVPEPAEQVRGPYSQLRSAGYGSCSSSQTAASSRGGPYDGGKSAKAAPSEPAQPPSSTLQADEETKDMIELCEQWTNKGGPKPLVWS